MTTDPTYQERIGKHSGAIYDVFVTPDGSVEAFLQLDYNGKWMGRYETLAEAETVLDLRPEAVAC